MRALRATLAAAGVVGVIWILGGPIGALLNAPGLLAQDAAGRLGVSPADSDPSLRAWLWLGTGISAAFWGLAAYGVLAVMDRKGRVRA